MFLPTTIEECKKLGWKSLDVILVSGDTYIDSSYIGISVIGKVLLKHGFRVGIIAQPDIKTNKDILRLGEPNLFWGVTSGSVDSLVTNYTASKKWRKKDDYTPGGVNDRRPDRAVIAYTNLIKRFSKDKKPIVIGGIEASLRRVAHYDFWSNKMRGSILFNSKADILVYGMGERAILEIAHNLKNGKSTDSIRGTCIKSREIIDYEYIELPSLDEVKKDKLKYIEMFHLFYQNNDALASKGLYQKHDSRYLIQNPPALYLDQEELDEIYGFDYENELHPYYRKEGKVKALDTIKYSISTHRGCYGACNFCAIAVHQGRTVRWRSEDSIVKEAERMASRKDFNGYIKDVGGATANMYGFECKKKLKLGSCKDKECIYPTICPSLKIDHSAQLNLLDNLRKINGVKKVFITSGLRYDMIIDDKKHGDRYLKNLVDNHVSGQLKIAPEHMVDSVLECMGKPHNDNLVNFKKKFNDLNRKSGQKQFLTYYLIAAHPGSTQKDMAVLKEFTSKELNINPEQVQIFTPTPSTYSTLMYYTELDPFTLKPIFVEKNLRGKEAQKNALIKKEYHNNSNHNKKKNPKESSNHKNRKKDNSRKRGSSKYNRKSDTFDKNVNKNVNKNINKKRRNKKR